jgi:hypothetical protein
MMPALLLAQDSIIHWVNISLAPIAFAIDMIEAERQRTGVDL